jgi:CRISPR-associated protein Cmr3
MKFKITLTPLEPFIFGGDNTFGKLGDKDGGTYLVKSRQFPQQSAILGMIKKQIMTQSEVLTRKVRGEWVDKYSKT